jgi:beta-galactosidase
MNRLILLGAMLCLLSGCGASGPFGPQRDRIISDNWKFIREDVRNGQSLSLDDSKWQRVDLPHSWNGMDGQDGGNNYYRGPGWYRKKLALSHEELSKSLFLRFEAASMVADVYVNGQRAGSHRGAFGAFCFEITHLVRAGDNIIAVRVDNSRQQDVPPLSGDFTISGGLYRDVHLLSLNPLSISPTDDASPGVYLKQTKVSKESADVEIVTKLRNASYNPTDATVECVIRSANGMPVARQTVSQQVPRMGEADAVAHVTVAHPVLWNAKRDREPYRYWATITVMRNDRVVDEITQPLGLRYFSVDPENGFFLNGEPYSLHGVNIHQEWPNQGWAIKSNQIDENYKLVNELGATVVRMAHYQHPEYEYNVCDREGLIVWAELAMVNRVEPTKEFFDDAKQQFRELIKQNYNHPSICFWSMYNELIPPRQRNNAQEELLAELNDLAHELDPTRPTTGAVWGEENLSMDYAPNWRMDVTGINRYYGWYYGSNDQWTQWLGRIHEIKKRPVAISEYGFGGSIHQHELNPTTRPAAKGPWHPEEWQAIAHEQTYPQLKAQPWLWGTFIWCMFDFASDGRREGDAAGINDKGLVTHDRKTRKDAFYYYKAQWSTDPFVYITSRRFNPHPAMPTTLKVYSNCASVELFLNGQSLGQKCGLNQVFTWENIALDEGKADLRAVGDWRGRDYSDRITWIVSRHAPATAPASTTQPASRPASTQSH